MKIFNIEPVQPDDGAQPVVTPAGTPRHSCHGGTPRYYALERCPAHLAMALTPLTVDCWNCNTATFLSNQQRHAILENIYHYTTDQDRLYEDFRNALIKSKKECQQLEEKLQSVNSGRANFSTENKKLKQELKKLRKTFNSYLNRRFVASKTKKAGGQFREIQSIRGQLKIKEDELNESAKSRSQIEKQYKQACIANEKNQSLIAQLRDQLEASKKVKVEHDQDIHEHHEQLKAHTAELERERDELREKQIDVVAKNRDLTSELAEMKSTTDAFQVELEVLAKQLNDSQQVNVELEKKLAKASSKLETLREQHAQEVKPLKQRNSEMEGKVKDVVSLQRNLAESAKNLEAWKSKCAERDERLKKFGEKFRQMELERRAAEEKIQRMDKEISDLTDLVESYET